MVRGFAVLLLSYALLPSLAEGALNFQVADPGGEWTPGEGWGVDANEKYGTLLGATFQIDGELASYSFVLDMNNAALFQFGTISLTEPDAKAGLGASETDYLDITATLTFVSPPGVGSVNATSVAITGAVSDKASDVYISFAPTVVEFGDYGQFTVELGEGTSSAAPATWGTVTLNGNPNDTVAYVWARITLDHLNSPDVVQIPVVVQTPEPATFFMWGAFGISGCALARRRRLNIG